MVKALENQTGVLYAIPFIYLIKGQSCCSLPGKLQVPQILDINLAQSTSAAQWFPLFYFFFKCGQRFGVFNFHWN